MSTAIGDLTPSSHTSFHWLFMESIMYFAIPAIITVVAVIAVNVKLINRLR